MVENFAIAMSLVFGTTLIHTICTIFILIWVRRIAHPHWSLRNAITRATVLAILVMTMSLAAYVEAALWAAYYYLSGALPTLADSLYFSLVTFTTLGYGDITLGPPWRVLAAFEAANGIIMFGWTTAIIVAAGQRVFYMVESQGAEESDLGRGDDTEASERAR